MWACGRCARRGGTYHREDAALDEVEVDPELAERRAAAVDVDRLARAGARDFEKIHVLRWRRGHVAVRGVPRRALAAAAEASDAAEHHRLSRGVRRSGRRLEGEGRPRSGRSCWSKFVANWLGGDFTRPREPQELVHGGGCLRHRHGSLPPCSAAFSASSKNRRLRRGGRRTRRRSVVLAARDESRRLRHRSRSLRRVWWTWAPRCRRHCRSGARRENFCRHRRRRSPAPAPPLKS